MTEPDQKKMDEVLRRMLNTPPKPHKPVGFKPANRNDKDNPEK